MHRQHSARPHLYQLDRQRAFGSRERCSTGRRFVHARVRPGSLLHQLDRQRAFSGRQRRFSAPFASANIKLYGRVPRRRPREAGRAVGRPGWAPGAA
eukprot:scaffold2546_cov118-Isochrysis_galbana.AAC.4